MNRQWWRVTSDWIVLFYMDSLNKTRSLFYIKVHEMMKALIKDIGLVNRVHLTVLSALKTSISWVLRNAQPSFGII